MGLRVLSRSSLVVVSTACVVLAPATPEPEAVVPGRVTLSYLPTAAFSPLPPRPVVDPAAPPMLLTGSAFPAEPGAGEAPTAMAEIEDIELIDVINAISAAGYLLIAVPSLLFTVPIQLITGQSDAIVASLNNIVTAVNTILKLVGRSIEPLAAPQADHHGDAAPVLPHSGRADHDNNESDDLAPAQPKDDRAEPADTDAQQEPTEGDLSVSAAATDTGVHPSGAAAEGDEQLDVEKTDEQPTVDDVVVDESGIDDQTADVEPVEADAESADDGNESADNGDSVDGQSEPDGA